MKRKTVTGRACVTLAALIMTVALSFVGGGAQPVAAGGGQSNLECGTTVTGRITDGDYFDYWYFSGKADDKVTITMTRTSGNLKPMVRLFFSKPGGSGYQLLTKVKSVEGSSSAVISTFTLPKTGMYSIKTTPIGGKEATTTGDYNITLACSAGASSVPASDDCRQLGHPIVWEGMIEAENNNRVETKDGDFWAFKAASGDRVRLEFTSSAFEPSFRLFWYESGWKEVGSAFLLPLPTPRPGTIPSMPATYAIDERLNKSGCYYVWIKSRSEGGTGGYFLKFRLK